MDLIFIPLFLFYNPEQHNSELEDNALSVELTGLSVLKKR